MFAIVALLVAQDRVPPPVIDPCNEWVGLGYAAGHKPAVARQGDTVELTGFSVRFNGGPVEQVPDACVTDWKVEGEGVKLLKGGKIKIDPSAVPGTEIRFSAQIGGAQGRRGYGSFKIIGLNQKVLSGTFGVRRQERCETPQIAEMSFSADGHYSYTRPEHMVETMVSGSGRYRWDGDTGKLELGGTAEPFVAERTGTAKWVDGALVLEGVDPSGTSSSCRITLGGG